MDSTEHRYRRSGGHLGNHSGTVRGDCPVELPGWHTPIPQLGQRNTVKELVLGSVSMAETVFDIPATTG